MGNANFDDLIMAVSCHFLRETNIAKQEKKGGNKNEEKKTNFFFKLWVKNNKGRRRKKKDWDMQKTKRKENIGEKIFSVLLFLSSLRCTVIAYYCIKIKPS